MKAEVATVVVAVVFIMSTFHFRTSTGYIISLLPEFREPFLVLYAYKGHIE